MRQYNPAYDDLGNLHLPDTSLNYNPNFLQQENIPNINFQFRNNFPFSNNPFSINLQDHNIKSNLKKGLANLNPDLIKVPKKIELNMKRKINSWVPYPPTPSLNLECYDEVDIKDKYSLFKCFKISRLVYQLIITQFIYFLKPVQIEQIPKITTEEIYFFLQI